MNQSYLNPFRPVIAKIPGMSDPTSGDFADLPGLPDPEVRGECTIKSSLLCEPAAGVQRMDPMDMTAPGTSFTRYVLICQACYDQRADEYVRYTHGR
jgi:hypothetical protein